jgi:hypothetical protein
MACPGHMSEISRNQPSVKRNTWSVNVHTPSNFGSASFCRTFDRGMRDFSHLD